MKLTNQSPETPVNIHQNAKQSGSSAMMVAMNRRKTHARINPDSLRLTFPAVMIPEARTTHPA